MAKKQRLEAELGLNTQPFEDGLKKAEGKTTSFGRKMMGLVGSIFSVAAIAAFTSAVIKASEGLSDKFSFAVAGAKGVLTEFLSRIASANFSGFIKGLRDSYVMASDLAEALDKLKDKKAFVEFTASEKRQEAAVQAEIVNDRTGRFSIERRKQAARDLKEIEEEIKELTRKSLDEVFKLESKGWENRNHMTVDKGRQIFETVTNMSEMTKKRLDEIFTRADEVYGKTKDIAKKAFINQQAGAISEETVQAYREYLDLSTKEEDAIPKLYAIFQSYNEGKINAQERFNAVLRITNELLKEEYTGHPKKITEGYLKSAEGIVTAAPDEKTAIRKIFGFNSEKELKQELAPKVGEFFDQGNFSLIDETTKKLSEQQEALLELSDMFSGFFTNVDDGFQGMIDGVIKGIERLVVELLAKAAILAILSAITGVPMPALNTILPAGMGTLMQGASGGTASAGLAMASAPMGGGKLSADISGKKLKFLIENRS